MYLFENQKRPKTLWENKSNFPLDSQKTNLLKTKTVDFSINKKQFSSNYFKTIKNNNIILIEKYKKL